MIFTYKNIINLNFNYKSIFTAISSNEKSYIQSKLYGKNEASKKILKIPKKKDIWETKIRKYITYKVQ